MTFLLGENLMKKFIILTAIFLISAGAVFAEQNYDYPSTLINRTVTVPAGETFNAIFLAPINTSTAFEGQEVFLALSKDFYFKDNFIAAAGSTVLGKVIDSDKAKHGSIGGKLMLRFTSIITPSGQNIPISAIVRTEDNTGIILGGSKFYAIKDSSVLNPESASDISSPGISKISYGKGAIMMNEVGTSGGGLFKSIWDKGEEVDIPINASVDLILTQPITVKPLIEED